MLGWNVLHLDGKKNRINWFLTGKYELIAWIAVRNT
jgi:hypothetical protein